MATLRRVEDQVFASCRSSSRAAAGGGGGNRCAATAGPEDWAHLTSAADFERRAAAVKSRREGLLLPGELRALEAEKTQARLAEERKLGRAASESRLVAEAQAEEKRKQAQAHEATLRRAKESPDLRTLRRHLEEVETAQMRQLQVLRKEVEAAEKALEEKASKAAMEAEILVQGRTSAQMAAESRARALHFQNEGEAEQARKTRQEAQLAAEEKQHDKRTVQAAVCRAQDQDFQNELRRRKLQAAVRTALDRLLMEQCQLREQEVYDDQAADALAKKQQGEQDLFWSARVQERRAAEHARAQVLQKVAACLAQKLGDEERLHQLQRLVTEEAAAAALRREEERGLERRLEARAKAVKATEDGLRNLRENRLKEQAEEEHWRACFVEKCAQEAKVNQLSDQKRRMRLLAFKREAEEATAKRRELREAEAAKEEAELQRQRLQEAEQKQILEEERLRLLEIHARGGLLDRAWFNGTVLPKYPQDHR